MGEKENMIEYSDICKNRKWWSELAYDEMEIYMNNVFQYYRIHGFPFYKYSYDEIRMEIRKLYDFNLPIINQDTVTQTMHGLGLCWSFFPHAFGVKNLNSKSPIDIFLDDDLFKTAIRKRIQYGSNISHAGIRKAIRKYGGVGVSNFRPSAACAIYKKYGGDGVTWDMCGGYGGRLLGAFMSKRINHYIATEPDPRTVDGLEKLGKYLYTIKYINIFKKCAEDFKPWREEFIDLCFTSPPYFNTERYALDFSQSYIKFPTYPAWIEGFWRKTLENCMIGLKKGGYLIFNVADVKTAPTLEVDTTRVAQELGFKYIETLKYQMSGRPHKTPDKAFKYEPIFVFRKE